MAYVDGVASRSVVKHIRSCPACAGRARELSRLQALLTATLYRSSCPDSEQLIAFHQGELQGNEKLVVAQHLRGCPHCARELATLARDERESLGERMGTALKVLVAARMAPQAQPAAVRDRSRPARTIPQVFRADDVEFILTLQPSFALPHQQDLSGVVHVGGQVPETIGGARVELYRDGGLISITHVTPRGHFTFAAIDPDEYDLSLLWGDRDIWLRGVRV
jgi:glutaredoxin